jgi:hypothetical protein
MTKWLADRGFEQRLACAWYLGRVIISECPGGWKASTEVAEAQVIRGRFRADPESAFASLRDAVSAWLEALRAADLALECIDKGEE